MAALEVVKNRLDKCGLGDFCLELHSRKSNKKELLLTLQRTLAKPRVQYAPILEKLDQLENLKAQLNSYARELRDPFGHANLSPYALFGIKDKACKHFAKNKRDIPRVVLPDIESSSQINCSEALSALSDMAEALPLVSPLTNHPWFGCSPGVVMPSDQNEIEVEIRENIKLTEIFLNNIQKVVKQSGIKPPTTVGEIEHALSAASIVAASKPINKAILLNKEWNDHNSDADSLVQNVDSYNERRNAARTKFNDQALDRDIRPIYDTYLILSVKLFRIFDGKYLALKQTIRALYKNRPPLGRKKITGDLLQLVDLQNALNEIHQKESIGKALFGSYWKNEHSDSSILKEFSKWIVGFRRRVLEKAFTDKALDIVCQGVSQAELEMAQCFS